MSETLEETRELYHNTKGGICNHRTYFMSCEDFDGLWLFSEGLCQICKTPERETRRGKLCIDHLGDYGRGNVRGLLCDKCNCLMARVDAHRAHSTPAVSRYRYNSWFSLRLMHIRGFYINPTYPRWEWAS